MTSTWDYWAELTYTNLRLDKISPKGYLAFCLVFVIAGYGFGKFTEKHEIAFNMTESLPHFFFIVEKGTPNVINPNDMVQMKYISNAGHLVWDDGTLMVKRVLGVEGDDISINNRQIVINGMPSPVFIKPKSRLGVDLKPIEPQVIKKDEYFLYTTHTHGFDSRYAYMGMVKKEQIIGKVVFAF